ncbi:MAG: hypothetical protein M1495_20010 [Bacteroidetes bacterium]|nr:hypothetical protein [Bacteroidota bacterium]
MEIGNGTHQQILQVIQHFDNVFGDTTAAVLNVSPASLMLLGDHTHYNEGILKHLREFGLIKYGFDCVVLSTVPECLGMGSYAAHQIGFLNALKKLYNLSIDEERLLDIVRKNEFGVIGKISNVAHHYTVQYGKEKKLFFTDLRTYAHKSLPLRDDKYSIVICDTSEKIVDPQKICNERIEGCEVGVKGLRLYIWGERKKENRRGAKRIEKKNDGRVWQVNYPIALEPGGRLRFEF